MSLAASHVLPEPSAGSAWRWELRRTLAQVRDQLAAESTPSYGGWLAAREERGLRERGRLLRRIGSLSDLVHGAPEPVARDAVGRLVADVERHARRARALHMDSVQLDLGGSD